MLRRYWPEAVWAGFAAIGVGLMLAWPNWLTVPFHSIWVTLAILYGFRRWTVHSTIAVGAVVSAVTGAALLRAETYIGAEALRELTEVPLMAGIYATTVWHARRRQVALDESHRARARERDFARNTAHGLRTPITVARGYAELIQRADDPQTVEDASVVIDELDRLKRMSDRLMLLAAADRDDFLALQPVELEDLVRSTAHRWETTADRQWEVAVSARGMLLADGDRLSEALDALVENAVRATQPGDRISLIARREHDQAVIEIADEGAGIPREQREEVFQRFRRLAGARPGGGGTGLGLAIVRAVVSAHEGTVSFEGPPGGGARFIIRLPGLRLSAKHPSAESARRSVAGLR